MNCHCGTDFAIYGKVEAVLNRRPVAVTFGNFDGVHLGHQKLISDLRAMADGHTTVALTFDPHPTRFFARQEPKPLLTSLEQRIQHLLRSGADVVYVQQFDFPFSELTADDFCQDYLPSRFMIYAVLLGFNFCYGKKRAGCWTHFKPISDRFGWKSFQAASHKWNGIEISSSKVRESLLVGDVSLAKNLLGRPYSLEGCVVEGDKKGRTLGFPTANIAYENEVIPQNGVYAVQVQVGRDPILRLGALNCGFRPTMGSGLKLQIEVHILDFDQDIYGEPLQIFLFEKMRSEVKFNGLEGLKAQIARDIQSVREYFSRK